MMKTLINRILLFSIASLMLGSCKKDETKVTATDGTAAVLTASAANLVLTESDAANNVLTFSWIKADYGFNAAVSNTLQIAVKGTDFAAPKSIPMDANTLKKVYTVSDFNNLLLSMGLLPNISSLLEVRLKSQYSDNITPLFSAVISLTVKPYKTLIIPKIAVPAELYIVGSATPGEWNNPVPANQKLVQTDDFTFVTILQLTGGKEFLLLPVNGSWDTKYGVENKAIPSLNEGGDFKLNGGDNFPGPTLSGTYKIEANFLTGTFTIVPFSWGIIGSATITGWDSSTDMQYDNVAEVWSVTTALTAGADKQFKFRFNNDWNPNFGSTLGADGEQKALTGGLQSGGKNFGVANAGTYKIELDLINNTYTLTPQ